MHLALTMMLVCAGGPQDALSTFESPDLYEYFFKVRAGAWGSPGFEFQATREDMKFVRINDQVLFSAGADLGVEVAKRLVLFGTVEGSGTDNIRTEMAGAYLGFRDYKKAGAAEGIPDRAMIYAGGIWGRFEVTDAPEGQEFGDFDDAFGLGVGLELTWDASRVLTISLIGEYRLIKFDYDKPIVSGDDHVGGSTGWVGAAFEFRF